MSVIKNIPVCDLRMYTTPEAVGTIEKIKNVAILIQPEDASPEILEKIARIEKRNIAMTLSMTRDQKVSILNGGGEITDSSFSADGQTVLVVNGAAVIRKMSPETKGSIIANGGVIVHESLRDCCPLQFLNVNGAILYEDFDDYKMYSGEFKADNEFFSYLEPKTLLIIAGQFFLNEDVQISLLQEKQMRFIVVGQFICPQPLMSYMRSVTQLSGQMLTPEEYKALCTQEDSSDDWNG